MVFYAEKAIDRSPYGTGTCARMAQLYGKGKLDVGEEFVKESLIETKFVGKIESVVMVGNKQGIIPSVRGCAKVFGHNAITIDKNDDPQAFGFQI